MAEMSREDVIERLRWIDREAHDEWVLVPAEREAALRHAIAALADLSRYKALVERLAKCSTPPIGDDSPDYEREWSRLAADAQELQRG